MNWLVKAIGIMVTLAMGSVGCVDTNESKSDRISYPHVAGAERKTSLLGGLPKIAVGMSAADVQSILGDPDEINPTYDSIHSKTAQKIGHSFVYIIQRKQENGSMIEKNEKLIRVHFGLDGKVSRIIRVGLP